MKKINYLFFNLLIILSVFSVSCSDKGDTPPPEPTKTQLITQGSWTFDKAMTGSVDVSSSVPACYKDNVVSFTSATNGTVTNTVVCTPTDNTPATFTWSWQNNEMVLRLSAPLFPGGTGDFNLNTLTATSLVVNQDVTFPGYPTTNVIFYYKH